MKYLMMFLFCLICHYGIGQTYEIEVELLNKMLQAGDLDPAQATERKKTLDRITDRGATYPVLPYDSVTKRLNFTYIIPCGNMPQKVIHRRVREWCALRYVDTYAATRHEDPESGKIITKGTAQVRYTRRFEGLFGWRRSENAIINCHHTFIFTSKDGKMKIQIEDLRFIFVSGGYSIGSLYVPVVHKEVYLSGFFPIVENEYRDWEGLVDLIRQTAAVYVGHVKDLGSYVNDWEADYRF